MLDAPPQAASAEDYADLSCALGPMLGARGRSFESKLAELLDLHVAGP